LQQLSHQEAVLANIKVSSVGDRLDPKCRN